MTDVKREEEEHTWTTVFKAVIGVAGASGVGFAISSDSDPVTSGLVIGSLITLFALYQFALVMFRWTNKFSEADSASRKEVQAIQRRAQEDFRLLREELEDRLKQQRVEFEEELAQIREELELERRKRRQAQKRAIEFAILAQQLGGTVDLATIFDEEIQDTV